MNQVINTIPRGLLGGAIALVIVFSIWAFRLWWSTRNFSGGVCLGNIWRPETGIVVVATFILGYWIAWRFMP
jgi:hypothetical protein